MLLCFKMDKYLISILLSRMKGVAKGECFQLPPIQHR